MMIFDNGFVEPNVFCVNPEPIFLLQVPMLLRLIQICPKGRGVFEGLDERTVGAEETRLLGTEDDFRDLSRFYSGDQQL